MIRINRLWQNVFSKSGGLAKWLFRIILKIFKEIVMTQKNRWKGFVIGVAASAAGLVAMKQYWQLVAPKVNEQAPLTGTDVYPEDVNLDDIAVSEKRYKEDESSTAALGRMVYKKMAGREPRSKEAKEMLSYLTHWVYGLLQGGLYGAFRGNSGKLIDFKGGAVHGAGLWLLGDEVAVPMLGLQKGPTATSPAGHINRLGAHLAYGLTTAATTQLLNKLL
jgi:hypothetical protein